MSSTTHSDPWGFFARIGTWDDRYTIECCAMTAQMLEVANNDLNEGEPEWEPVAAFVDEQLADVMRAILSPLAVDMLARALGDEQNQPYTRERLMALYLPKLMYIIDAAYEAAAHMRQTYPEEFDRGL